MSDRWCIECKVWRAECGPYCGTCAEDAEHAMTALEDLWDHQMARPERDTDNEGEARADWHT